MPVLTKRKDTYVAETEEEAVELINEAKATVEFTLTKYSNQKKVIRKTGEEYFLVTLEKEYGC